MEQPPADWLAMGGAYWVIFVQTLASAAFFSALALRFGKSVGADGDGCLLALVNFALALLGSAIGFLVLPYPKFLVGSLVGTILLPTVATIVFRRSILRR